MPGFDFRFGLLDERFRDRIVWIEGRNLRLKSLVIGGDVA